MSERFDAKPQISLSWAELQAKLNYLPIYVAAAVTTVAAGRCV